MTNWFLYKIHRFLVRIPHPVMNILKSRNVQNAGCRLVDFLHHQMNPAGATLFTFIATACRFTIQAGQRAKRIFEDRDHFSKADLVRRAG